MVVAWKAFQDFLLMIILQKILQTQKSPGVILIVYIPKNFQPEKTIPGIYYSVYKGFDKFSKYKSIKYFLYGKNKKIYNSNDQFKIYWLLRFI